MEVQTCLFGILKPRPELEGCDIFIKVTQYSDFWHLANIELNIKA